jgi:hypothetical protein
MAVYDPLIPFAEIECHVGLMKKILVKKLFDDKALIAETN